MLDGFARSSDLLFVMDLRYFETVAASSEMDSALSVEVLLPVHVRLGEGGGMLCAGKFWSLSRADFPGLCD